MRIFERRYRWVVILLAFLGFVAGALLGCKEDDEPTLDPCAEATGSEACRYLYGDARPYCTNPSCDPGAVDDGEGYHGCVETQPSDECKWQLGDPTVDIDREPRPADDQSPDFAGADRVP